MRDTGGASRKPRSALGLSNIQPLLPWILGVGKCLQLVLKLISHAYNNDIMIAFQPSGTWPAATRVDTSGKLESLILLYCSFSPSSFSAYKLCCGVPEFHLKLIWVLKCFSCNDRVPSPFIVCTGLLIPSSCCRPRFTHDVHLSMVTYTHSTWAIVVMQEYNPSNI